MSEPFIGEIRWFPYMHGAPTGWQACDGSLLSIQANSELYSLINTTYGGDGSTTFAVPDLRGAVPVHQGAGQGLTPRVLGQVGGAWAVTLTTAQIPAHSHQLVASTDAASATSPVTHVPAKTTDGLEFYVPNAQAATSEMYDFMLQSGGGGQPHDNCMPMLALTPCIALAGIFPSHG